MPTVLTWTYWGEHQVDEENGDVQRIKPGGIADDDQLGEVTIISLDTGIFTVETGAMGADGKRVQTRRTAGHIRAKVSEPAAGNRISPTGRPGQQKGAIFQFFGAAGAAASPTIQAPRRKGKAARGLGRTVLAGTATQTTEKAPHGPPDEPPSGGKTAEESALKRLLGAEYALLQLYIHHAIHISSHLIQLQNHCPRLLGPRACVRSRVSCSAWACMHIF